MNLFKMGMLLFLSSDRPFFNVRKYGSKIIHKKIEKEKEKMIKNSRIFKENMAVLNITKKIDSENLTELLLKPMRIEGVDCHFMENATENNIAITKIERNIYKLKLLKMLQDENVPQHVKIAEIEKNKTFTNHLSLLNAGLMKDWDFKL